MKQIRIWTIKRGKQIAYVRAEACANMPGAPIAIAVIDGVPHEIYLCDWRKSWPLPKSTVRHADILRAIRRLDPRCEIIIYGAPS